MHDGILLLRVILTPALELNFNEVENERCYNIPAIVDQAYIYDARNEPDMAVRYFSRAADLLPDKRTKSKMLYESARIYAERNGIAEAITLLNQSLRLDSKNYRASVLKQKLIADGSVNRNAGLDTFLRTGRDTDQIETGTNHTYMNTDTNIDMNTDMNTDRTGAEADQNSTAINPR